MGNGTAMAYGKSMTGARPFPIPIAALIILPLIVVLSARAMTQSDWAAANASVAALLFAWIVADTLALSALARAKRDYSGLRTLLGALALAGPVILVGAGAPVRDAIYDLPLLISSFALVTACWLVWSALIFVAAWREHGILEQAFAATISPILVRTVFRLAGVVRIALFSWRDVPDVPTGASGHAYHRYLAPLLWVFLGLQAVELAVVHLLLMLWNETVAWLVFALTAAGVTWLVAMIKNTRLAPVLLTDAGIRVRCGILVDFLVPYEQLAVVGEPFDEATLRQSETMNLAILSSSNVTFRLSEPVTLPALFGGTKGIRRVALKLDEPSRFLAELERRKDQRCGPEPD